VSDLDPTAEANTVTAESANSDIVVVTSGMLRAGMTATTCST
jgi:hypothetical protein